MLPKLLETVPYRYRDRQRVAEWRKSKVQTIFVAQLKQVLRR
jgi:hypothetical protein